MVLPVEKMGELRRAAEKIQEYLTNMLAKQRAVDGGQAKFLRIELDVDGGWYLRFYVDDQPPHTRAPALAELLRNAGRSQWAARNEVVRELELDLYAVREAFEGNIPDDDDA